LLFVATHLTSHTGTDIRAIGPDDDLDALKDLARRAFGPGATTEHPVALARQRALIDQAIATGRIFGAFSGGQLVASARWHDMRQWWHGRSMPMAGVAAVMVAPEHRGRGVGRTLMTEVLDAIAGRGYPVSVLYPATTPIYRSLGWELAGPVPAQPAGSRSGPKYSRYPGRLTGRRPALRPVPAGDTGRRRRRRADHGPRPRARPSRWAEYP
jgi:predicted N-acetyltransferase YhbS